jgi:uncharacterized membrane protein
LPPLGAGTVCGVMVGPWSIVLGEAEVLGSGVIVAVFFCKLIMLSTIAIQAIAKAKYVSICGLWIVYVSFMLCIIGRNCGGNMTSMHDLSSFAKQCIFVNT